MRPDPARKAPSDHGPESGHAHEPTGRHTHEHPERGPGLSPPPDGRRMTAADWDARYAEARESGRIWTGEPNHALVVEVADLPPGRALDVGCGEGGDAIWLAGRGWQVTALDPSRVAVDRARDAATAEGRSVDWRVSGLDEVAPGLPDGGFELVSTFYPTLFLDTDPIADLTRLTAVGGTLLVVHHADFHPQHAKDHGWDPSELMMPDDVAAALAGRHDWVVEVHEHRARQISGGAGAHHNDDVVVRARRVG